MKTEYAFAHVQKITTQFTRLSFSWISHRYRLGKTGSNSPFFPALLRNTLSIKGKVPMHCAYQMQTKYIAHIHRARTIFLARLSVPSN